MKEAETRKRQYLESVLFEKETLLSRMANSRSWRWTAFLRKTDAKFSALFRKSKKKVCASETKTEQINQATQETCSNVDKETGTRIHLSDAAVIITCHNYGKYLAEAIESALKQTHKPKEIVIIDDDSHDNTEEVARRYLKDGVRYIKCKYNNPSSTRNHGAKNTNAPFIVFLDADDTLEPDYVKKCLLKMQDPSVAIAYGDMRFFGEENTIKKKSGFNRTVLYRENYISSHAMIRRQAFDMVGGYREHAKSLEDWDIYRMILMYPWKAEKADTYVNYRSHKSNRSYKIRDLSLGHWEIVNLMHNPITIFTPFAGRFDTFERYLEGIKKLDFSKKLIRLHWFDTSGDEKFGDMLRKEISKLPFGRTTYSNAPLPDFWNHTPKSLIRNRINGTNQDRYYHDLALVYAYNNFLISCDTELALTLEDDIELPPDALTKMIQSIKLPDTVAVVASYNCQLKNIQLVWKNDELGTPQFFSKRGKGIEKVDGGGFGCTLFRMHWLKSMPIYTRVFEDPAVWYDHTAFAYLRTQGNVICNWDVHVNHLETERFM
ncbi:TPA: glycosyltransferase family 2 protein [Candidatus Micrarchaeota archaeon]|nr:glycosyltransferase family 2 protein [Candidatus Micrarchaeota archaeon]